MNIVTTLKAAWQEFLDWLESFGEDMLDFLRPAAEQIARNGGEALIQLAREAVEQAQSHAGTGGEKFAVAWDYIRANRARIEGDLSENAARIAIEAAVAALKSR